MNQKMNTGDIRDENPAQLQALQQQQTAAKKCPRCESMETKFCYFNNYSKYQPRYYCKGCRRYWTLGGTLRNVPVGGSRKSKRPKTAELRPIQPHPQPQPQMQLQPAPTNTNPPMMSPLALGCYFPVAGGFLPPFEAMQPLQMPQGFNPSLNSPLPADLSAPPPSLGMFPPYMGDAGPSSYGFQSPSSYGFQEPIPQAQAQPELFVDNRDKAPMPMYPNELNLDMGLQQQNWAYDFINNDKPNTSSGNAAPMWSLDYAADPMMSWKHFQQN